MSAIQIIRNPHELRTLAGPWNELAEPFKTPLLRYEWFAACAEALCGSGRLYVIVNNGKQGINGIAALGLIQDRGLQKLALLGTPYIGEPSGLLYRDEKSLLELIDELIRIKKPIILSRVRSGSLESIKLQERNRWNSFTVVRKNVGSPFLPISHTWDEFERSLSSRKRYDLRRARKRAEGLGKVQFEIILPGPDNLDHYLEEVFLVEASGWKGRTGTAIQFDKRLNHFFRLYSEAAARLGTLRLCFLRINHKPVAVLLAVQYFNRFWAIKLGYDESFSRCSPGILLMNETIRYAFDNRLEAYEFLGNDEHWIHMWTEQNHSYLTARIYPFSPSGQFSLVMDIGAVLLKKMKPCGH